MKQIIVKILTRCLSQKNDYMNEILTNNDENRMNDIPFGSFYKEFLQLYGTNLITLLLHADGVSITRSSKLKMWMLSASIIELPPKLRSRRCNMVPISIWIGHVEPVPHLWFKHCVPQLESIKFEGKHFSSNSLMNLCELNFTMKSRRHSLDLVRK